MAEITGEINERLPSPLSSGGVYGFLISQEGKQGSHCQFSLEIALNEWIGATAKYTGQLLIILKNVILSDETQVVVDQNIRVFIWRRPDEIWWPSLRLLKQ